MTATAENAPVAAPAPAAADGDDRYNAFFEDVFTKLDNRAKSLAAAAGIPLAAGFPWADIIALIMGCFASPPSTARLKATFSRPGPFDRLAMRRAVSNAGLSFREGTVAIQTLIDEGKQAPEEKLALFCNSFRS